MLSVINKKKFILCCLIILMVGTVSATARDSKETTLISRYKEQVEHLEQISKAQITNHHIATAYNLKTKASGIIEKQITQDLDKQIGIQRYIFISLSMSESSIINLLNQAKQSKIPVFMRGFKNNSYQQTVNALDSIIRKTEYGVIIDPEKFRDFDISVVPTFVEARVEEKKCTANISCSRKYNKIIGNVSVDFAYKKLGKEGEVL